MLLSLVAYLTMLFVNAPILVAYLTMLFVNAPFLSSIFNDAVC